MSVELDPETRVDGAHPILLNGQDLAWRVAEGGIDVFAVALEAGVPAGAREHVCRLGPGQVFFGIAKVPADSPMGLLAVGLPRTRLQPLGPRRAQALDIGRLDDWLRELTRIFDEPAPRAFRRPDLEQPMDAKAGDVVYAQDKIVWVRPSSGSGGLERMPIARPAPADMPFPLTPSTWLHVTAQQQIACAATADLATEGVALEALDAFHATFLEDLRHRRLQRDAAMRQEVIARRKADATRFGNALARLAGVIRVHGEIDQGAGSSGDAVLHACQLVLTATGVRVKLRGDAEHAQQGDYVYYLARQAKVAVREVALTAEGWWRQDAGAILASRASDGSAVALLPTSGGDYMLVDPADGSRTRVDAHTAAMLAPRALTFFRSFPDQAIGMMDLLRFGATGAKRDMVRLAVFGVLGGLLALLTPIATGLLVDTVIPSAQRVELVQLVLLLLTASLGVSAFELARNFALLRLESRTDYTSQAAIIHRLLHLPAPFFRDYSAGDLAQRAYGINSIIHLLMTTTQSALFAWVFGLFSYAYLFFLDWRLALLATVLVGVSLALTTALNAWRLGMERRMFQLQGEVASRVLQILNGIAKLRAAGAEQRAFALWADRFGRQKSLYFRAHRIGNYLATFDAGYIVLTSLLLFGMIALLDVDISTGTFLAFNAAFSQFVAATLALSAALTDSLNAIPLYERAKPIMQARPESSAGKNAPGELSGAIDINHVTFGYDADGPPVLNDVSLRIEAGEFVAIVGPTGSGKSTLFRLLLGFERPQSGAVYYDGQDLAGLDIAAVRHQLGVVLQNGKLMPGDVFTNIVGSTSCTLEEAWEAARMAGFAEDIEAMPMGMNTVIAEGMGTISGGQRQRLMIARAIVRRPRILLFDEATSALDNATQAIVARSVERLNATRIVVAHRLSTIAKADRIFVLEAGRVAETGGYEELMKRDGPFAQFARRQIA